MAAAADSADQRAPAKRQVVRLPARPPEGWTLGDCAAALDLWCEGYSRLEIADAGDVDDWDIEALADRFKWPRLFDLRRAPGGHKMRHWKRLGRPAGWSQADLDRARAMWDAGDSQATIGNAFGKRKHQINGIAHRLGWPRRASPIAKHDPTAPKPEPKPKPDNRPPLPAGHPLTWGAISSDPYPG